jgi:hypothetical protein
MIARAKGSAVAGFVRFLRSNREKALALLKPELHRYLNERILLSSWYPEEDFLALLHAQARILDTPATKVYEVMGAVGARYDLTGVYKNLLRPNDPAATLANGAVVWRNYHDTGDILSRSLGPRRIFVEVRGYPFRDREFCRLNTGYFEEALKLSGAVSVACRHVNCTARGDDFCAWDARWAMAGEPLNP